jgi:hypothetical protein
MTLRVGDTISAAVGPERGIVRNGQLWPKEKEVVLLLRRTASKFSPDPRPTFEIVSARANGQVATNAHGIIAVEPESAVPDPAHADGRCFRPGAVFGQFTKALRFRKS